MILSISILRLYYLLLRPFPVVSATSKNLILSKIWEYLILLYIYSVLVSNIRKGLNFTVHVEVVHMFLTTVLELLTLYAT
jgi:hypothetical protein